MTAELKVYNVMNLKTKLKLIRSVFIEEISKSFVTVFKLFSDESRDIEDLLIVVGI